MMILYCWADGDGAGLGFDWAEVGGVPEGSTPVNSRACKRLAIRAPSARD